MSRDLSNATAFKKPTEFLQGLWGLDKQNRNPNFGDLDPADLILDENGKQLEVNGQKLSAFLNDPSANYLNKTLDQFLNEYVNENPNKSLKVIGPDAKPHIIGGKAFDGDMKVQDYGYIEAEEPEPKKPGLWTRFLNLFVPQKEVQEYNNYQRMQSSPIMQKCQEIKAAREASNRVVTENEPKAQKETKQQTRQEEVLSYDENVKIEKITETGEASIALAGEAMGPAMDKLKNNGMFKLGQDIYMSIVRDKDSDFMTEPQKEIGMFAENMLVSMQCLEDYANNPKGVDTNEVKQHIANVVTFGIVANDRTKQFKILEGISAEELAENVANSQSFQSLVNQYSTDPKAEKSLVDLARNVSKGQVSEISNPFRKSLPNVRASMNKAPEAPTVQRTQTRTMEAGGNVL